MSSDRGVNPDTPAGGPADQSSNERVRAHLAALDEELARLRALDAAMDARRERSDAELEELSRVLGRSTASLRELLDASTRSKPGEHEK